MKVVVCLKHVPDPREPWRFEPAGHTLLRDNAEGLLDPLGDHALEAVMRWRDAGHDLTCWALTMGPPGARDTLKRALAKGADHAVWIQDPALAGSDLLATSRAIAAAVRQLSDVSVVLMGDRSMDASCGALAPMVAERLGWPSLQGMTGLDVRAEGLEGDRLTPRSVERVLCPLPAVVSVGRLAGAPRLPTFTGIMGTSKKELVTWSLSDLGLRPEEVGHGGSGTRVLELEAPPERPAGRVVTAHEAVPALLESLDGLRGRP